MNAARSLRLFLGVQLIASSALAQTRVEVVPVVSKSVERQVKLPGEFQPYLAVPIYAKVSGFVQRTNVDRGSIVKQGQALATLEAPEMQAQIVEAESKAQALELQRAEAEAKLAAAQGTYDRLKAASATPGVVAENDVQVAQKTAEAAQAMVRSYENSIKAAQAQARAVRDLGQYLQIRAPFDGIITERNVNPGALVGPGSGATPLFRLHQVSRLRLVVAVPEAVVGGIVEGRASTVHGARLSRRDVLRCDQSGGSRSRSKNANDAGRTRGEEHGPQARLRDVLRGLLAGATPAGLVARAPNQRRDDDGKDVRDPGEGGRGRVGERRSRRSSWRLDRSLRSSEGRRSDRAARQR